MIEKINRPRKPGVCLFVGSFLILALALASEARAESFGGRSIAASVRLPLLGSGFLRVADTGDLPAEGGWQSTDLPSTNVADVLKANVLVASTSGALCQDRGTQASSSTSLADLGLFAGKPGELRARFVRAHAEATAASLQGSSQIDGLTFGRMSFNADGTPNQRVELWNRNHISPMGRFWL